MGKGHEHKLLKRHLCGQKTWKNIQHHWSLEKCKPKPPKRYHLTPVRMAIIKKQETTDAGEAMENQKHFYTVGVNVN